MDKIVKNDLSEKYNKGIILIHWISFLLIVLLIPTGFIMSEMEAGIIRANLLKLHMATGIIVFILTILRVFFFFRSKRPSKLQTGSNLHNKLVIYIENAFYFILILLCISGFFALIMSNLGKELISGSSLPRSENLNVPAIKAHNCLAIILIILFVVHVGGVISHYVKNKENTLKRITF